MRNLFQLEDGMAIPRYNEMYFAFLTVIADGQQHSMADIVMQLSGRYSLSEAEKNEMLPSGSLTFNNRVAWTRTYLKKAGLIAAPARGMVSLRRPGLRFWRILPKCSITTFWRHILVLMFLKRQVPLVMIRETKKKKITEMRVRKM